MSEIKDNPPPLPESDVEVTAGRTMRIHSVLKIRQIEAAAFSRGVAAGYAKALEAAAKEFDRRSVYADGSKSTGWYEVDEPAEIIRNLIGRIE